MDISKIEKGMLVECRQGTGTVLEVDQTHGAVVIEERNSHQKFEVDIKDLIDDPQLHLGCDKYY
ncbi:hypothetical protein [Vibrio bivalvicida]|uniref:Malate dehydrogenase n=1 Tax=Vibrio bivalvicida TaxID=1276888 RepID=A0ABV4MNC8_9VIBR